MVFVTFLNIQFIYYALFGIDLAKEFFSHNILLFNSFTGGIENIYKNKIFENLF